MKKVFRRILVSLLTFSMLSFPQYRSIANEDLRTQSLLSYYKFLQRERNFFDGGTHIKAVYLKDVTGDGVEELIFNTRIFSYIDGELKEICGGGAKLFICTGVNGDISVCHLDPAEMYRDDMTVYYGFKNGKEYKKAELLVLFIEWYNSSSLRSRFSYNIDGKRVEEEQFKKKLQELQGKEIFEVTANNYMDTINVLDNMFPGLFYPSNWAKSDVYSAFHENVVPEKIKSDYTNSITREEFCELATMFYERYRGKISANNVSFSDTTNESVLKMASLGIVTGIGGNQFAPNDSLTREMAASILIRLANSMKIPLNNGIPTFTDNDAISSWAYQNVGVSQSSGIMSGNSDGTFAPKNHYTREQAIATVYRLTKLFVPVQRIEIKEKVSVIVDENCAFPDIIFYPENATDITITFKSSNEKVFSCDTDKINAVEEGSAQLTAVASNGFEAKTSVNVTPKVFISVKPELNTPINIIEDSRDSLDTYKLNGGGLMDDFPNGKTISSKLKVTNVEKLLRGKTRITAVLAQITNGYDDKFAKNNQPYLKWRLFDENGKEVSSGIRRLLDLNKVGDEETIEIDFGDLPKGDYTLEFVSLEGRTFDYSKEEPRIVVKGLPLKLSSVVLVEGSDTMYDINDDVTKTFTAMLEKVEYDIKYSLRKDNYSISCDFIGTSEAGSMWPSQKVYWEVTDCDGNVLDDGNESIYFYNDIRREDVIELDNLKAGETYYITIKPIKNKPYYDGVDYDSIMY